MQIRSIAIGTCLFAIATAGAAEQGRAQTPNQAQNQNPNIHVDPTTGMRWRREYRTVSKPVTETRMESKVVTISRPQVVTETEPVATTYYTPVVRHAWKPRWKGTWNPFAAPTLAYEFVPETSWEARSEIVHRVRSSTRWVAEQKVVQEPTLVTAIQQDQEEHWVAIGPDPSVRPTGLPPQTQVASLPAPSIPASARVATQPTRPEISGGMPPTVLGTYGTPIYSTTTIYR
jgi:hypothetical protein